MKTIDPRIANRRKQVAEERARGSARRVLRLLVLIGVVGAAIWVGRSPWFSVAEITVTGANHAGVDEILDAAGVTEGRPLLVVPARSAEAALVADPWVIDAAVSKIFPNLVEVAVIERTPTAIVSHRGVEAVVAADGVVVATQVSQELPITQSLEAIPGAGEVVTDPAARGGIEFFTALDPKYLADAYIQEIDGELWARIMEFDVRLGRPVDMAEKARSLSAVLDVGQTPGSVINVIAPARPTVAPPA